MPRYRITIINEEFSSRDDVECADPVSAREQAIGAALAIGTDQVKAGRPFFGARVMIEEDGEMLAQFIVSAGASPLRL